MSIKTVIYKLEAEKIFSESFKSSIDIFNGTIERFTKKYCEVNKMSYVKEYYEVDKTSYTNVLYPFNFNFKETKERYFNYILKRECDRRTKKLKKKYCIIPNPCHIIGVITFDVSPKGFKIEEL